MKIRLLLFAGLRERAGCAELVLDDLRDGASVGDARRELARRFPSLERLEHVRSAVGDRYVDDAQLLRDGDVLALIPPVSGGAPDSDAELERRLFELVATALEPASVQRRVSSPSCGAVVLFSGTTREENRGRRVLRLEYEAFASMTAAEMQRIFARCNADFGDARGTDAQTRLRMLVQHRTGVVAIGEPSVVIAVASPHRARAFDACRFLIDELKRSVPIWKKEFYVGGEEWIGERS